MIEPVRVGPDRMLVPIAAQDGETIGDALIEIGPDHPDYADWDTYLRELEDIKKDFPEYF